MKCIHNWKVLINEPLKPNFDVDKLIAQNRAFDAPSIVFEGRRLIILSCEMCGAVDKTLASQVGPIESKRIK